MLEAPVFQNRQCPLFVEIGDSERQVIDHSRDWWILRPVRCWIVSAVAAAPTLSTSVAAWCRNRIWLAGIGVAARKEPGATLVRAESQIGLIPVVMAWQIFHSHQRRVEIASLGVVRTAIGNVVNRDRFETRRRRSIGCVIARDIDRRRDRNGLNRMSTDN